MPMKDNFTSVRIQIPGRSIALTGLAVAASTAITSAALGAPVNWPPRTAADLVPLLGGGLPLLALVGSALSLFGNGKPTPERQAIGDVRALARELTEALEVQRVQVMALQGACETAMTQASAVSERVSAIANVAVDAETRLVAGVDTAEKALKQPVAVVSLAAEATQRVERALPELAEMVRSSLAAAPNQAFTVAAERLSEAVETAVGTFRSAIDDATGRIAALNDISVALRRDALALDLAGREIATAGASVVARAGETISNVDQSIAALPDAIASVTAAAGSINDASARLQANGAALNTAGQKAEKAVEALVVAEDRIGSERQAVEAAAERMAGVVARVDAVRTDAVHMAQLTERLREVANLLADGTGNLDQAGQRVSAGVETAYEEIRAAGAKMIAEVLAALAPLPGAAAQVTAATDRLTGMSDRLAENSARIEQTGQELAQRYEDRERKLAEAEEALLVRASDAIAPLTEVANALAGSAGDAVRAMNGAASDLRAGQSALESSGRESMLAAATLLKEAGAIRMASQAVADTDWKAAAEAVEDMRLAANTLTAMVDHAATLRQDLAGLNRVAGTLETTTANLAEGAAHVEAAGRSIAATGESVAGRLLEQTDRMEVSMRRFPEAAAEITSATSHLRVIADAMPVSLPVAAARIEAAAPQLERLETAGAQLEAIASRLPEEIAAHLAAAMPADLPDAAARLDAAMPRLDALDTVTQRLEVLSATLPADLASRIADALPDSMTTAAEQIKAAGERLDLAASSLPTTAARLEAVIPAVDRLNTLGTRLEIVASSLPAMAAKLDAAAPAVDRLDALGTRLESAANGLPGVTERLEAAAPVVERFDAIGTRLEAAAGDLPAVIERLAAMAPAAERLDAIGTRMEAVAGDLPAVAERLEAAAPAVERLNAIGTRLDAVADAACRLEAAVPAVDRLDTLGTRLEAVSGNLPIMTMRLAAVAPAVDRLDTIGVRLEAVAGDLPATAAKLEAMTPALDRLDTLGVRLETIAGDLPATAAKLEAMPPALDRLDTLGVRLEAVAASLPADIATSFAAIIPNLERLGLLNERLEQAVEHLPQQLANVIPAGLPDAAVRLEAVAERLDQLDTLGAKLEGLIGQIPAGEPQDATATALAALSGEVGEAVQRVEAALTQHDGALAALISSVDRVQTTAAEVQAARAERPVIVGGDGALPATLKHLETVSLQTEALVRQTEALAEAVLAGRAPGLSTMLADQGPSLLSGVETTTRRLRSVATALALALASDGPAEARRAR